MIGEGLCPFASPVFSRMHTEVYSGNDANEATSGFMDLLQKVAEADPDELPTALFVTPRLFSDFDAYWNWFLVCDNLLVQLGYEGRLQLATFHPHYVFEGEEEDDLSHYTNRSPYPMLHIIREDDIEEALASVRYPERIPERNRQHMRRLGRAGLLAKMPELADTPVFESEEPEK